jgi:hypothetical protein
MCECCQTAIAASISSAVAGLTVTVPLIESLTPETFPRPPGPSLTTRRLRRKSGDALATAA